ncbi:MAG: PBECR4 domain-containing protein [Clostridiaceae bacterium]|nr:PBECR4 domain-containing protein [Clostridiaceae bacterium]
MITTGELLNLTRVPKISEISFKLLQEFYDIYICPNIYVFQLENKSTIELEFLDVNFCHLMGFQHIVPYKLSKFYGGENGYIGVFNGNITIKKLRSIDSRKFARDKDKILCFSYLYKLLRNCEIIKFSNNILRSRISCEFILYDTQFERRIHLGIEKDEKRGVYYPRTFIVERENGDRYVSNQVYLKIVSREIISKYPFKTDTEVAATIGIKKRAKKNKILQRKRNRQSL